MCQYDKRCRVGCHRSQTVCTYARRRSTSNRDGRRASDTQRPEIDSAMTLMIPFVEDESPFAISDELRFRLIYQANSIRACGIVLEQPLKPVDGSLFHRLDTAFALERFSVWVRAYLRSAAEHLAAWADMTVPYGHPRPHPAIIRARPFLVMGRSALESAAHALWPLCASSEDQCLERFAQLVIVDMYYFSKALQRADKDTKEIDQWINALTAQCEVLGLTIPSRTRTIGQETLVYEAARALEKDPQRWCYLWNVASGAGHGQKWFTAEGHLALWQHEYEPGHYDQITIANSTLIVEMIEAAGTALLHGTLNWLACAGHDPGMIQAAARKLSEYFPSEERPEPKPRPFSRVF